MDQSSLITSLRDTQRLLEGRMDEIDTLTSIVRLLSPSLAKDSFFIELAEMLFSRNNVEKISFFKTENKDLIPAWRFGSLDAAPEYTAFAVDDGAKHAKKTKEVVFGADIDGTNTVYVPLLFGEELFGIYRLEFSTDNDISPFSRPFFYLFGSFNAAAIRMMDEWKRLENTTDFLKKENKMLKEIITGLGEQENTFVFRSSAMNELVKKVDKVKNLDVDILLTGESGTGKDLLTRYIHYSGNRDSKPFIAVNCAAIPESLVEGELFGIEEGVATGVKKRKGKFEVAHTGTIFLDEVGELPLSVQAKLLRLLQEKKVTPVGSTEEIELDIRVIAATNRDILTMVKDGRFREDLYYRLNNFPLYMPALRERKEDIVPLFLYFFKFFTKKYDKTGLKISDQLEDAINSYTWPGNVRELKNRVLQAVVIAEEGAYLTPEILGLQSGDKKSQNIKENNREIEDLTIDNIIDIKEWLKKEQYRIERKAFIHALIKSSGVKKKAAELLDISLRSFHYKFKELGIEEDDYQQLY